MARKTRLRPVKWCVDDINESGHDRRACEDAWQDSKGRIWLDSAGRGRRPGGLLGRLRRLGYRAPSGSVIPR